jgi:acetyl/propionyl-CoA carboxylase alpha subunit/acetyl-CoA carboxylase carboxyltransferase component
VFERIAIVNRGEPAMRAIHAVREWAHERGTPVRTVALHTHAERTAMFAREADESVRIGPGPGEPAWPTTPYLDHDELARALTAAGADAAWVGWGFVAEHADFSDRCAELGVTFVGPTGDVMRRLGDKIGAKLLAEQAGVPVAAWSGGAVADVEAAREHAGRIGYPLMIKAAAGGGGRGIRLVLEEAALSAAFERASAEAARSFGDPTVFMERVVTGARHIEVQIVADQHGGVWPLGVRDCSIQRRNQKVLEESASTALDAAQEDEVKRAAAELARLAGYTGAGTVEFLYQPEERSFAFLEVNTRLQVEHPVTEATTGVDLVKLQLDVAAGEKLEGDPPPAQGHAIEVRLNAEDPERGFSPAPGTIERLRFPTGPGLRVDTGVAEGDVVPPEYDSMIAKLIAWGRDRPEATARLVRALEQTSVLLRGGTTNRAFLLDLVRHPDVVAGTVDTTWLDRLTDGGGWHFGSRADVALVAAAIDAYDEAAAHERARFLASAARGRPQAATDESRTVDLRLGGSAVRLEVSCTGPARYLVVADGHRIDVAVEQPGPHERRLTIGDRSSRALAIEHGADVLIEVDGTPHRISQDDAGTVRAPGPSVVVAVTVAVGDEVAAGAPVAVLESMKMETVLAAPFAGRVVEVLTSGNVQLDAGAPVVRLEPTDREDGGAPVDEPTVSFEPLALDRSSDDPLEGALAAVDAARRLVLGYDAPAGDLDRVTHALATAPVEPPASDPTLVRAELAVLRIFTDVASLSRNRRVGDAEDGEEQHSAREYLHAYLRSLDVDAEGLPASFQTKLARALAHHGMAELTRTPALEEALYRIHLAQQRATTHVPLVLTLLERRLRSAVPPDGEVGDEVRETLDRLVLATQVRFPAVADLARRVRYASFDEPRLRQEREAVEDAVREHLHQLAVDPDGPDREARMAALVAAPQPLLRLLVDPVVLSGGLPTLLEVLTRRYYRTRRLGELRRVDADGLAAVVAEVEDARGRGRIVAVGGPAGEEAEHLTQAVATAGRLAAGLPEDAGAGAVADLYLLWPEAPDDLETIAIRLSRELDAAGSLPPALRRVTLTVVADEVHHLTFRRTPRGFAERRHLRGIHPLIAGRLELWRLSRFALTRLPSSPGVELFHATAREEPSDERLFAFGEVRDLTHVRDERGRIAALPELERVLAACLDDLRRARAAAPPDRRPDWNRVVLNLWPPVEVPVAELEPVVRALAPTTEGLGLEQVMVLAQLRLPDGSLRKVAARIARPPGQGFTFRVTERPTTPLAPMDATTRKVVRARQRGTVYPYELVPLIARGGTFSEHDLDADGQLVPVDRPPGGNQASIVVGVVVTPTERYPEGMTRVAVLGDPTKGLGSLAEAECRRVLAALDLADGLGVPVEWFAVSSGARIAMDSGTENMDWVARVLRRIIGFTQAGGQLHVVVAGINVGAQPYWNAEATMLMHTKGILVMTPDSAMVLTGKQALDYSGGVSAEDNFGIGGYDRVMGPNGQAQYWAPDLAAACELLLAHHEHSYVAPGERFPRPAATTDPRDRDVRDFPHEVPGVDFTTVGDIFSEVTNPGRKKPFDIRTLLRSVSDQDHEPLERWAGMAGAEVAVVLDAHLGGHPITLLGIESRPLPRRGPLPADGPETFTAGTLFPRASKKVARAINAASGIRPLVVLANLSGFDGSPESLRELQLEYGAEIGRAVVNFDGPIVFCVVSRYHGGAFVVFSKALNDRMEVAAVAGSHASVIGGPPAAAVVFAGEVRRRTERDPRVGDLQRRFAAAEGPDVGRLRAELERVRAEVRSEMLGAVAAEFDAVHSVERAREVGSIDRIVAAAELRPYLIEAVQRGVARVATAAERTG